MIYLIKRKDYYEILEAECKTHMPFFTIGNYGRHFYYSYLASDGKYGEFDGRKIIDKTTSKSMDFARKKWAEYLI